MKFVKKNWQSRSAIIVGISLVVGLLMITLEQTPYASDINAAGYQHGGEGKPGYSSRGTLYFNFCKSPRVNRRAATYCSPLG